MAQKSKKNSKNTLTIIAIVFFLMISIGIGLYYYGHTCVAWWRPVIPALACGIALAYIIRLVPLKRIGLAGTILSACVATAISWTVILSINYHLADMKTEHEEKVSVDRKLRREHDEYRHAGRRRIRTGRKTYTYAAEVLFPDGHRKEISLTLSEYNHIRTGDSLVFSCRKGSLGYPVFDREKCLSGN